MQAIILAGGFGMRLQLAAGGMPKPMLRLAGKPLLAWQLERLQAQGITEAVICVHHHYHMITDYFGDAYAGITLQYSIEDMALGTGGAIRAALRLLKSRRPVFVLHGDTVVFADLKRLRAMHVADERTVTLATHRSAARDLRLVVRDGRAVACDPAMQEEVRIGSTGLYMISPWLFDGYPLPKKFSFEKDFLARYMPDIQPAAYDGVHYVIDIDTPQDYARAQAELPARLGIQAAA